MTHLLNNLDIYILQSLSYNNSLNIKRTASFFSNYGTVQQV